MELYGLKLVELRLAEKVIGSGIDGRECCLDNSFVLGRAINWCLFDNCVLWRFFPDLFDCKMPAVPFKILLVGDGDLIECPITLQKGWPWNGVCAPSRPPDERPLLDG